jgi:hypothetical protein
MHRRRDGIGRGTSEGVAGLENGSRLSHHCALRLEPDRGDDEIAMEGRTS